MHNSKNTVLMLVPKIARERREKDGNGDLSLTCIGGGIPVGGAISAAEVVQAVQFRLSRICILQVVFY